MDKLYDLNENGEPTIAYCLKLAEKYYSKEGYDHALRVMRCVENNFMINNDFKLTCMRLALMHDLLEDTEYKKEDEIHYGFNKALLLLTKEKGKNYIDYIKNIKMQCEDDYFTECAYYVKLMDVKDHLIQRETLTDKLKNKYTEALSYLL